VELPSSRAAVLEAILPDSRSMHEIQHVRHDQRPCHWTSRSIQLLVMRKHVPIMSPNPAHVSTELV
jgi:hypothetical protein